MVLPTCALFLVNSCMTAFEEEAKCEECRMGIPCTYWYDIKPLRYKVLRELYPEDTAKLDVYERLRAKHMAHKKYLKAKKRAEAGDVRVKESTVVLSPLTP